MSSSLSFRLDGTIDPAQLEGMPEEFVRRVTDPEFVEQARLRIALDIQANKRRSAFFEQAAAVKRAAIAVHESRRPSNLSGRQRKLWRKSQRARLHLESKQQGGSSNGHQLSDDKPRAAE